MHGLKVYVGLPLVQTQVQLVSGFTQVEDFGLGFRAGLVVFDCGLSGVWI